MKSRTIRKKRNPLAMILASAISVLLLSSCTNAGAPAGSVMEEKAVNASATAEEAAQEDSGFNADQIAAAQDTAQAAEEKTETVHVSADAEGKAEKITVEATLKHPAEGEYIRDTSRLDEISNKKGDEEFALVEGQEIIWQNAGEDITYEGTSKKELPVQVKIAYYLDGNEISPEKLAGKSGEVRICFDYKNQETKEVAIDNQKITVNVPFAVISMMTIPKDHFKNVEVENGKIMTLGDQEMVIGYAFPGLKSSLKLKDLEETEHIEIPDHVEITADVSDFSLDYTAHIISNGLLSDADLKELDDAKDMADGIEKLMDASGKLVDGMQAFSDGTHTYAGYLAEYTNGVASLDEGLSELSKGTNEMDSSLSAAAKQLKSKLDEWDAAAEQMQRALAGTDLTGLQSQMTQKAAGIQQSLQDAGQALSEIDWEAYDAAAQTEQVKDMAAGAAADAIDQMELDGLSEEQKNELKAAVSEEIRNADLDLSAPDDNAVKQQTDRVLTDLSDAADGFSQLQSTLSVLQGLRADKGEEETGTAMLADVDTGELRDMIDQFVAGMHQLSTGAATIEEGADTLAKSGTALKDGYGQIVDGGDALLDGMKAFDKDGIGKLSELAGDDLTKMIRRLQAVQKADQEYTTFSGLADGTKGSVRFVIETGKIRAE